MQINTNELLRNIKASLKEEDIIIQILKKLKRKIMVVYVGALL
jgi:hypothetical protein